MILYNCAELADGCFSCTNLNVAQGLECGWCNRVSTHGSTSSCSFIDNCGSDYQCVNMRETVELVYCLSERENYQVTGCMIVVGIWHHL